jgi:hypothetical protein
MTTPQGPRAASIAAAAILALTCSLALAEAPASQPSAKPAAAAAAAAPAEQPAHVIVQHILIAFEGTLPGKNITRTKEAARALAAEVLAKAQKGEDFDALADRILGSPAAVVAPKPAFGLFNRQKVPARA